MIAHYLIFVAITLECIFIWIGYFTARWVINVQLANDMTILYKSPVAVEVNDDTHTEDSFKSLVLMNNLGHIQKINKIFLTSMKIKLFINAL